jgi:hypothetical protein
LITVASAQFEEVAWKTEKNKLNITYKDMSIEFVNMTSQPTLSKNLFIMDEKENIIGVDTKAININSHFSKEQNKSE